ncbi:MAG: DUF4349 domain-containing protein [Acetivibrionales bacterium]|jgi:hypothetical protein
MLNHQGNNYGSTLKKSITAIALLLILAFLFTSCGSGGKSTAPGAAPSQAAVTFSESVNYDEAYLEAPQAAAPEEYKNDGGGLGGSGEYKEKNVADTVMSQRKIIMNGDVSLETLDFDDSIAAMDQLIKDFGGFAEVRNVKGKSNTSKILRSASYIIRVPAESFELVLKSMGSIGTVLESNTQGTDITDQYYDAQTRIDTLKVQEKTLLDILAKSTKLEDVIILESRLAEVRYEIEKLENTVKNYDRLVAFSRITVHIQEVDDKTETKPEPETLGERISRTFEESVDNFRDGVENFLLWLVYSWINILFMLVVFAIAFILFRRAKKRSAKKNIVKAEITNEEDKKQ